MSVAISNICSVRIASAFPKLVRLLLGAIFIYSSIAKIRQPFVFVDDVRAFDIIGSKAAIIVGSILPWMELLLGFCLIFGFFVIGAFVGSALLGFVFMVAAGTAIMRGLKIECGCFGREARALVGFWTAFRSGAICSLSIMALMVEYALQAKANQANK